MKTHIFTRLAIFLVSLLAALLLPAPARAAGLEPPPGWTPQVTDSFDSSKNDWPSGTDDNDWVRSTWKIAAGKYTWQVTSHKGFIWYAHPSGTQAADFYLSAEVRQASGTDDSEMGLAFFISDAGYCVFTVSPGSTFSVYCLDDDEWKTLVPWKYDSALRSGEANRLAILAQGERLQFSINDRLVAELDERPFSSGRNGLTISLPDGGIQANFEFDEFMLYTPNDARSTFQKAFQLQKDEQYAEAIELYQKALAQYEAAGDLRGQALTLNNMGSAYDDLGVYQAAIDHLERSIEMYKAAGYPEGLAYPLDGLGSVYRHMGETGRALEYYQQALDAWRSIDKSYDVAFTLRTMGNVSGDAEHYEQAADFARQAASAYAALGDRQEQAYALHDLGYYLDSAGQYDTAEQAYQEALALYRQAGDEEGEASVYLAIGWVYKHRSEYRYDQEQLHQALVYLQRGLDIHSRLGSKDGQAEALHDLALVYEDLGDYAAAVDYNQKAVEFWRRVGNRSEEAWALNNLGWTRSRLFDFEGAMSALGKSLAAFQALGDQEGEAWVLGNIAKVTINQLGYRKAVPFFEQQLAIRRELDDRNGIADSLNELGKACIVTGDYEQGLDYFAGAVQLWREEGDRLDESRAINNMGVIYSALGDDDQAMKRFQESLAISIEIEDPWREAIWRSNIGEVYQNQKDYDQALTSYEQARALFEQVKDPRLQYEANVWVALGEVHQATGKTTQALEMIRHGLALVQQVDDTQGQASALQSLGKLYLETGDDDNALKMLNQALEKWRQIGSPSGEAETLELIGQVYEQQGKPEEALQQYLAAVDMREAILGQAQAEAHKAGLAAQGAGAYQRAVRLLVDKGDIARAFELSERSRARAFLDSMGNRRPELSSTAGAGLLSQEQALREEIAALEAGLLAERSKPAGQQNAKAIETAAGQLTGKQKAYEQLLAQVQASSPELASLVRVSAASLADVQAAVDANTTLLAYFLADSKAFAFIITTSEYQVVTLSATPEQITAAVESFRAVGLANLDDPHARSLHDLYDWLVAPLKAQLRTPAVLIVPHQALHYAPFAALFDGQAYFGEQHVLAELPAASALPLVKAKQGRPGTNPLVLGNPSTGNPDLQPLKYAETEARQVASLYGASALLEQQASEQALRQGTASAGLVHLAAHAALNPTAPMFSRLWLAPGSGQDGRMNLFEVYSLDLSKADLVVLSACQTQGGQVSAGDEVLSLNRAFLYGASSVLSSLWPVDDAATGALMQHFYVALQAGQGKAEALSAAQAGLRSDAEHPEWAHPFYWAAFTLNGDAGQIHSKGLPHSKEPAGSRGWVWLAAGAMGLLLAAGLVIVLRRRALA